jgi:putative peptidoglycan lipid II flippase
MSDGDRTPSARRGAVIMMGGTLASRVTGLLRTSLLNQLFDSRVTDAFTVAVRVPNLFRELLAEGALANSFVPTYAKADPATRVTLARALFSLLLLVNGILTLAAVTAAPWVVDLLLGGPGSVDRELAIMLTRAVFPFLLAVSLSAWAMGILQARERFLAPAWAPVALNVVAVAGMLAYPGAALPLAVAFALGGAAQFAVQLPALARVGALPRPVWPWHPQLVPVLILMLPFAFTTSGRQALNVIATRVLNDLPAGSQTAWFNADLFLSLALGLFAVSPAVAWYARLSNLEREGRAGDFGVTLQAGLRFIAFWSALAGGLLVALAEPAVRVVFDWLSLFGGGLDDARLRLTVEAARPIGLAVLPLGLHQLLTRAWYVRGRVRTPIVVALVFLSLQGALFFTLGPTLGVAGLAWSAAAAAWVQLLLLGALTARRERLNVPSLLAFVIGILALAAAVSAAAWGVSLVVPAPNWWGWLARLAAGGSVGLAVYLLAGQALRLDEARINLRRA